ncbi:MAG TPA: tRNA lysidine(34) synthetase TilS [Kofleriaceae bacterium]|nr:tRNA lysidine(34) synthetase TilS [Kofleriaceae bacterium]
MIDRAIRTALADLPEGARVGVALSGGADSMTLADATIDVLGPARVLLLHIDHQLRGPDAAARDRDVVIAFAQRRDTRIEIRSVRVEGTGEAAARRARYAALAALADEHELARVLTGHTASDQAETVLMRILRGTGPAGLAGIAPRRGRYVRPLLATTRNEIEAYVRARALAFAHDHTNDDPRFFRNRIRHTIMPALARENPQLERALCRLAASTRAWRAALTTDARALLAAAARDRDLHAPTLARAPDAVLGLALSSLAPLDAPHVRALIELIRAPVSGTKTLDLPSTRAVREYELLRFDPADPEPAALSVDYPEPFTIRLARPGDRMRPARLRGRSRKLSDLYIDARVPRRLRSSSRVVVRDRDSVILWAEHLGPAFDVEIRVAPA